MDVEPGQDSDPTTAEPRKRRVEVVTVPVKTIGRVRRAGLRLATWLFGSPLTWAMHWAIRVEGTYFELHRPGGVAKPRLRTSTWSEEKERDIITTVPIGSTAFSDEEIVALSEPYFTERTRLMWYSLYINNCQLFVHFALEKISPMPDTTEPVPPALRETISLVLGMVIHVLILPPILLYMRWLRWRGCDERNLRAYAALYYSATGLIGPMMVILLTQNYNRLKSVFEGEPLLIAAYASFITSIMTSSLFLIQPRLSFPVAKQRKNRHWEVSTIQKQNNEDNVDEEVKIKVTYPLLSAVLGACIGVVLWVVVATPYLARGLVTFLSNHLSFRSPRAFGESMWDLLTMPIFDGSKAVEAGNERPGDDRRQVPLNGDANNSDDGGLVSEEQPRGN